MMLWNIQQIQAISGKAQLRGPTAGSNATGKWLGPCSCEEIAEASGIVWNSTVYIIHGKL